MNSINIEAFSKAIQSKRGDRGLREVAKEIGTSVSTLSRVEKGNLPDIDTYIRICKWLDVSIEYYTVAAKGKEKSQRQQVIANLRADKELSPDISEALIKMIDMAYLNVKQKR